MTHQIYSTKYYSQLPARALESSNIMSLMQKGKAGPKKGNLVVNSLVVGGHGSLLERLSESGVSVTCAGNIWDIVSFVLQR